MNTVHTLNFVPSVHVSGALFLRAAGYVRQALRITLQRYNVRTLMKHIDLAGPMVDDHIPEF